MQDVCTEGPRGPGVWTERPVRGRKKHEQFTAPPGASSIPAVSREFHPRHRRRMFLDRWYTGRRILREGVATQRGASSPVKASLVSHPVRFALVCPTQFKLPPLAQQYIPLSKILRTRTSKWQAEANIDGHKNTTIIHPIVRLPIGAHLALESRSDLVAPPEGQKPVHLRLEGVIFHVQPRSIVAHLDEERAVHQLVEVCFGEKVQLGLLLRLGGGGRGEGGGGRAVRRGGGRGSGREGCRGKGTCSWPCYAVLLLQPPVTVGDGAAAGPLPPIPFDSTAAAEAATTKSSSLFQPSSFETSHMV